MTRLRGIRLFGLLALLTTAALTAAACEPGKPARSTGAYQIDVFQEMHYTQSFKSQEPPRFLPPEGSIPITGGKLALPEDNDAIDALPNATVRNAATLNRAARLYNVNCASCHGASGGGDGYVGLRFAEYGAVQPPALASDRVADLAAGRAYASITNGFGFMPPFGNLLSDEERWALVHLLFISDAERAALLADPANQPTGGG